jgi:hypothetical protein
MEDNRVMTVSFRLFPMFSKESVTNLWYIVSHYFQFAGNGDQVSKGSFFLFDQFWKQAARTPSMVTALYFFL